MRGSAQPRPRGIGLLCMVRDRLVQHLIGTLFYGFDDPVAAAQGFHTARV